MTKFLALLGGLFALGLLLAGPASAHASVVSSDPADGTRLEDAPKSVTITFDENVGIGGIGYLHVTDQTGRRVDVGSAQHPGGDGAKVTDTLHSGLGDGTYTASYRVVSADSHPVAGTVRFVVGSGALVRGSAQASAANGGTSTLFDVSRWISYGGLALLGGSWLLFTVWPRGRDDRRAARLVWGGAAAAALGAVLELVVQGPYAAGAGPDRIADGTLLDATLHTTYGQLHCVRLVLLGALALVLARAFRSYVQAVARTEAWLAAALGVAIAYTFSAAGHADTTGPSALSVPLDMLHLLAMAAWLGGLIMLVAVVLPRRDPDELRAVLPVFSAVAFASVVVLAGTGTYAAFRGIGTVDAVFTTTYGLLIVAKIVLFLGLLALGNLSRVVVRRRFAPRPTLVYAMTNVGTDVLTGVGSDAGTGVGSDAGTDVEMDAAPDERVAIERLRRSVYVETLVGLVVLGLTAVLVAEPRGKEALAAQYREPVSATAPLGGGNSVTVNSDPGTHGTVQLTLTLSGGATARSVTVGATQEQAQIGPIPVRVQPAGRGAFDGSADLPVAGRWTFAIVVTRSAFDAVTTDVTLDLH